MYVRQAETGDVSRIAEIFVFVRREKFFPIFQYEPYSFGELQVLPVAREYLDSPSRLQDVLVYDDGIVRGFLEMDGGEIKHLYVESFFRGQGIGGALLEQAVQARGASWLWALEKNPDAIRFYERHGFALTGERVLEEDTEEYLLRMERK
ncbi:GNAT family N-acetyltransferase [Neglecta sp. X4]|uniref:GNAT family N-acetyltransferase n=1 Tax=unclassified Neglectibacter TaxID=2632164 RepID=UPI00136C6773|nr:MULTISPECIES: GNAT family N-acetyltransferase [unclassified Neglectibacter]NBI16163.1 GNAT family N-acetyltransferase [Neglectibacter sp. 59]NBJ71860.1 GNAT family N-acetyltransferase [Neglectibacter sp. X4]NCE79637.1 GNAT family N-acetyltransferase [Neglectibacter sp. X58]